MILQKLQNLHTTCHQENSFLAVKVIGRSFSHSTNIYQEPTTDQALCWTPRSQDELKITPALFTHKVERADMETGSDGTVGQPSKGSVLGHSTGQ